MRLLFHGVRGSIPVSSPGVVRYGGNTTCLEVRSASGELLIVDGGTGLRGLNLGGVDSCRILISHLHWDHVQGLPFWAPLYRRNMKIELLVPEGGGDLLDRLMDGRMFPVRVQDLPSHVCVREYRAGDSLVVGSMTCETLAVPHPGGGVGLRLHEDGRIIALSGDCELGETGTGIAERLFEGAGVAVVDGQYTREQAAVRSGWGHSAAEAWLPAAGVAGVRRLVVTHHDPDADDTMLDMREHMLRKERLPLFLSVFMAYEGMELREGE